MLRSTDGKIDDIGLGDFIIRYVLGEIRRIPGVGRATLFSSERSLRVWLDADKVVGYQLTSDDVTKAIEAQNAQVASGSLGPSRAASRSRSPRWCWSRASLPRLRNSAPGTLPPSPRARTGQRTAARHLMRISIGEATLSPLAEFRAYPHGVRWPPSHCPRRS